jgi:hypothetical protein
VAQTAKPVQLTHEASDAYVHHAETEMEHQATNALVHEDASYLRFTCREQGFDEVLLDVEVLVEKLGEEFLVVVIADAHRRKLEEAGHRRRHYERLAMA